MTITATSPAPTTQTTVRPARPRRTIRPPADPVNQIEVPDPAPLAAALAVSAVQATQGLRPPTKLRHWVEMPIYETIRVKAEAAVRLYRGRTPNLTSPHVTHISTYQPCPDKVEATVILSTNNHTRAVAIRLEWNHHHWQATSLDLIQ